MKQWIAQFGKSSNSLNGIIAGTFALLASFGIITTEQATEIAGAVIVILSSLGLIAKQVKP